MMHSIALKPFIPVPVLDAPIDGDVGIYQLTQFQLKNVSLTASPLRYVISLCSDSACASVLATYDQTTSQTGWSGQDALAGTAYVGGTTLGGSTEAVYTETSPLANGTQYWWRARSFDTSSGTYSLLSTISTFTTNYVPAAPTLYNPPVTGSSVTPEFQLATIDGDSDNVQYKIQICTNSTCTAIFKTLDQTATQVGWSGQDGDTDTTYGTDPISATNSTLAYYNYTLLDLTPNIQYWWRAYAIDPAGSITWSPASTIRSFVTNTVEVRILSGRIMSGVIK
jgi:hypothetical protein